MIAHDWIGVALAGWGKHGHTVYRRTRVARRATRQFAKVVIDLVLKNTSAFGSSRRWLLIILGSICKTASVRDYRA